MTKIGGIKLRIKRIELRIAQHKKYRGIGPGTFWIDVKAVDAAIIAYESEIRLLRMEILKLETEKRVFK